jgi:putative iron-dependent peroxidase
MDIPEPQPVLTSLTAAAVFLVAVIADGGEETVRDLLEDVSGLSRSVGFRALDGGLTCVVGIGADAYSRLFVGPRPPGLHPFQQITGPRHTAPATPGDLLFHIRAKTMDLCFELADQLTRRLDGAARVVDEVQGFRYFDQRDLLGFVDGTENPTGRTAARAVFNADASTYVVVQKYLHDIGAWNGLSTEDQERAVGRTKLADIELPDDVQPADSHVTLAKVTDAAGTEVKIVRDNMPFGRIATGERGTYFIGYAADPATIERMLVNMFAGNPPGTTDRLLDFSTAVTGCLFYVPSQDWLDDLPPV